MSQTMKSTIDATPEFEAMGMETLQMEGASVLTYALPYGIAFILIFFVMGGYLPTSGTRVSSLQATSSDSNMVAGQLFQAATWALGLLFMFSSMREIFDACWRMRAIIMLPILAVLSAAWSQDPATTVRRGVFLLLGTIFAFYLIRRFTADQLAQIIVVTGVVAGLLGIFVSVALPQYGRDTFNGDAWQGIFRSKNGCAQTMLFFLSATVCFRFRSKAMEFLRLSLYPLAGLLIIMAQAKTAWLVGPGLVLLAMFLSGMRIVERRTVLFLLAGVMVMVVIGAVIFPYLMPLVLETLGKDPGMSGRVPLWAAAIVSGLKHPILGYGYAAFWNGMHGESLNIFMSTHFEIYQAQNGLLEVWLELGFVGVALVLLSLFRAVKDALTCLQAGHSRATNWYICLLALTVAYNIDETTIASAHSLPWLLYLVACTGLAYNARAIRLAAEPEEDDFPEPLTTPRFQRPARSLPPIKA
jgi:exopolysaccharide production protein ExoQ